MSEQSVFFFFWRWNPFLTLATQPLEDVNTLVFSFQRWDAVTLAINTAPFLSLV